MTASGQEPSGGSELHGCPAADSVHWVVEHSRPGAPRADVATLLQHLAIPADVAETAIEHLHRSTLGETAIAEVTGWRRTAANRIVLGYVSVAGRRCELSWRLGADGRLEDQIHQSDDADMGITGQRTAELTSDTRAQLHAVFSAAYSEPDPDYLDRQLAALQGIGIATEPTGEVVGFTLYGWREVDLPVIGVHGVGLAGLMCVRPGVRRKGVGGACGNAAGMAAVAGPLDLAVTKLATPASLRMIMRSIPVGRWPTVDEPFALYRNPSATQLAVLGALADAHGCKLGDGAVGIGSGRPIGTPIVEPEVTPEQASLFDRVDRDRGDTLLWVSWLTPPPIAWFE